MRFSTNRRAGLWLVATALVATAAIIAADQPDEQKTPDTAAKAAAEFGQQITREVRKTERQIRRALQTEVTLTFNDKPLKEALRELADKAGVPLWIDFKTFAEEGVNPQEPVSANLQDVRVETGLELILSPLGLEWSVEDELLRITTTTVAGERFWTEVYDVQELLRLAEEAERELSGVSLEQFTAPVQFDESQFGGLGMGMLPGRSSDWLIRALVAMTSGQWELKGTLGGTAQVVESALIVRQTQRVHGEIAELLDALTRAARGELQHGAAIVHPRGSTGEKTKRIYEVLAGKGEAAFKQEPLRSALASLSRQFQVPVIVDEAALTEYGVSLDQPVDLHVRDLTLRSILKLLLEPLELTALVRFGALEVTSESEASEYLESVIYDVRNLSERGTDRQELLNAIQNSTSGAWRNIDGIGGEALLPIAGVLAVRQTQRVHAEIELLLADLRRTLGRGEPNGRARTKKSRDPQEITMRVHPIHVKAPRQEVIDAIRAHLQQGRDSGEYDLRAVGNTLVVRARNSVHSEIERFQEQLLAAEALSRLPPPNEDELYLDDFRPADWSGLQD